MDAVRQYLDVVVRYLDVVGVYLFARAWYVNVGRCEITSVSR